MGPDQGGLWMLLEHLGKPRPVGLTGTHYGVHRRRSCNTRSSPKSVQSHLTQRLQFLTERTKNHTGKEKEFTHGKDL